MYGCGLDARFVHLSHMSSYRWWVKRSVRNPSSALSTETVQGSAKAAVCSSYSSSVSSNGSLVGRPLRHALSM